MISSRFALTFLALTAACSGARNDGQLVGDELRLATLKAGALIPCPDHDMCVSSQAKERERLVQPLPTGSLAKVKTAALSLAGANVAQETATYLHITYTSGVFAFVDDVEFLLDAEHGVCHVRSASRFGAYDFGVNRRRVEVIRAALAKP